MGGSAIGGALARCGARRPGSRPIVLWPAVTRSRRTTPDTTVLCVSYSGDTEETLAAYEAAGGAGRAAIVCTTGGGWPRALAPMGSR